MKQRYYTLDKDKTSSLSAGAIANEMSYSRQRVWAWLHGENGISETDFSRLLKITGKSPSDLLTQQCLEFISNASINA